MVAVFVGRVGRIFFFFQAEDGIRDRNVTGVQTCALPISLRNLIQPVDEHTSDVSRPPRSVRYRSVASKAAMPAPRACSAADDRSKTRTSHPRSEERRVGKECRSRWAAEAEKKRETRVKNR